MLKCAFKIILLLLAAPMCVLAASSANYEITGDNPVPVYFESNSGSYIIEGTIEPIVGFPLGVNYRVDHGQWAWDMPAVAPAAPTGGGIARGDVPTVPGIDALPLCLHGADGFALSGTKDQNTPEIFINDSKDGVVFTSPTTWEKTMFLEPGYNTLIVYGRNYYGMSQPLVVTVLMPNPGDVNADRHVDDYDLSLLATHWQTDWCPADFNNDSTVDDYDLSILISFWDYIY